MNTLDAYTAEKLVAGKQAELRAEAKEDALRAALARESKVAAHLVSIRAIRAVGSLVRRAATRVWSGSVKGKARSAVLSPASQIGSVGIGSGPPIRALLVVVFAGVVALLPLAAGAEDQSKITINESAYYPNTFPPALAEGVAVGSGGVFGAGTTGTSVITDGVPGFGPCGQTFCDNGQDVYTFAKGTITVTWRVVMQGIDLTATSASTYTFMGTWRVTSGTGAYADAKGEGKVGGPCLLDVSGNSVCQETRTGRIQIEH